jgi:HK97 family phage major capsid protein
MGKVTVLGELDSAGKAARIKAMNDEMTDIAKEIEEHEGLATIKDGVDDLGNLKPHPGHQTNGKAERQAAAKSIGELFVESEALTEYKGGQGPVALLDVDLMATLLETTNGWAPQTFRTPRLVEYATRPIRVVDLIPQTTTTAAAISYMEETTFTNAAAETTEGSAKPEAALAFTERTDTVRKIAVWIPTTDEQLADIPRLQGIVENRLGFMVRQRLDSQILVGDGTAPNISGITDRSGIQTQAKGADPTPDAIYKAMTLIRVNAFAEPTGVVLHPSDWEPIRLLKTSDGVYIWGSPADAGPERIWGLPVVQTTAMTENTGLVGDFNQTELAVRQGVEVQISNSHSDYFVKNLLAIRAEMRAALAVYRPAAFATVTGI